MDHPSISTTAKYLHTLADAGKTVLNGLERIRARMGTTAMSSGGLRVAPVRF